MTHVHVRRDKPFPLGVRNGVREQLQLHRSPGGQQQAAPYGTDVFVLRHPFAHLRFSGYAPENLANYVSPDLLFG